MNRSESKFRNTASKMNRALVTLLTNKDFSEISIMEICAEAGVNRSTFYAHYDNTYDLLQESFQGIVSGFLEECKFDNPVDLSYLPKLDKDDLNFITPKYLVPYLNYIKAHKQLFLIYSIHARGFNKNSVDNYMIEKLCLPIFEKYGITDKKFACYMQKYFLKGIDAVVDEWVRRDCEESVEYICNVIINCIRPMNYPVSG